MYETSWNACAVRRLERGDERLAPAWSCQHTGDDVGEVEERRGEKDLLHALVAALHHQQPHQHGRNRHADEARDVKQLQAAGDAGELGDHIAEVGDDQAEHHEERDAEAVLFANEIAQAFAGDRAHARRHLLHHDQRDGHGNHHPQQRVAELRAGRRVGVDTSGVVVDVGGDEAGADDGQQHQQTHSPEL